MRSLLASALVLGLALPAAAHADLKTFGTDLSRPANSMRTCETGFFDPALIAGAGFPYQPFASCTWWSVGSMQGAGAATVPFGGGTVRRVRVKVGAVTGRMQVVALRLMRHPGSLADPACCFPAGHGPVFTPRANATTELEVDIPVKHETDPGTGIVNYDVLALSVLDDGVPVPASLTSDGGWGGLVAGMFPAYLPGEERTVGYGTVAPGHVLLSADIEPPVATQGPATGTTHGGGAGAGTGGPGTGPPPAPAGAALGASRATVRRGALHMPVTCSVATGCRGELVIERPPAAGAATNVRAAARRVVYGRARITLPANAKRVVRVALSRQGRKALRGKRRITALATVRLGGRTVASRTIALKR